MPRRADALPVLRPRGHPGRRDAARPTTGDVIRRRRRCTACDKRFTTYERVRPARCRTVVKKDGSRVRVRSRQAAALACCWRCASGRSATEQVDAAIDRIEDKLLTAGAARE
jgi:transcriptional repressor NrdR